MTLKEEGFRLAKALSRAGVCSRRQAETLIEEGRIKVGKEVIKTPAYKVTAEDSVFVDDQPVSLSLKPRLWCYYKKRGLVTTHHDPEGRPTVFQELASDLPRVISVGRLDMNSEGLLLLTNHGGLSRYLELPQNEIARQYRVRVFGHIKQEDIERLAQGIEVDGIHYGPMEVSFESEEQESANQWVRVVLHEGKNREIRNVFNHLGWEINRLIRISYGPFLLGSLGPGQFIEVPSFHLKKKLPSFNWEEEADLELAEEDFPDVPFPRKTEKTQERKREGFSKKREFSRNGRSESRNSRGRDGFNKKPAYNQRRREDSFGEREFSGNRRSEDRRPDSGDSRERGDFNKRPSYEQRRREDSFGKREFSGNRRSENRRSDSGESRERGDFNKKPSYGQRRREDSFGEREFSGNRRPENRRPDSGDSREERGNFRKRPSYGQRRREDSFGEREFSGNRRPDSRGLREGGDFKKKPFNSHKPRADRSEGSDRERASYKERSFSRNGAGKDFSSREGSSKRFSKEGFSQQRSSSLRPTRAGNTEKSGRPGRSRPYENRRRDS